MAVAHMLNLDKAELVARAGMVDYVKRCQVSIARCLDSFVEGSCIS